MSDSFYYDIDSNQNIIGDNGEKLMGGIFDAVGDLQLDFLLENGLKNYHKLLDIGCGCFR